MKKIYSFMFAAVALFAAASCNKELPQEENLPVGETVVYTASTDGADTKATLNEETKKSEWMAGDAITVLDGEGDWTFTTENGGANVEFSNSEGFGEYRPVMAVYPAGEYSTVNIAEKTVKAYIPTWQQAQVGTYHNTAALAVAYSESSSFAFKNAHALLKFTVNTDNVTHVVFHGNGSEAITGDVNVTLGAEGVSDVECLETVFTENQWNEELQKNEEIQVTKYGTWVECYAYHDAENKYFQKGETYYIAVAPQVFAGGVTVKVRINDGEELVAKTTTKRVETKINTILNMGEITYEAPVVHEWAVAGTFNEWNTTANPMELVDGYYVAKNITGLNYGTPNEGETGSSTGFKFVNKGSTWRGGEGQVTTGAWAYVWGDGSSNIYVDGAAAETAYDIYLNPNEGDYGKFVIVATGDPMPEDTNNPGGEDLPSKTIYFVPGQWASDGAWFAVSYNGNAYEMTVTEDGYYSYEMPGSVSTFGFWRMNPESKELSTANRWNEIPDVLVPSDDNNYYIWSSWNSPYGAWGAKPAEKTYGIVGVFNEWGDAGDDIPMNKVSSGIYVAESVTVLKAFEGWKIRVNGAWDESYTSAITGIGLNKWVAAGSGNNNTSVAEDGIYDIYLDVSQKRIYVMNSGVDYGTATEQTVSGTPTPVGTPVEPNHIYLRPSSNWLEANAHFAAWVWKTGQSGKAYNFKEHASVDGIYEIEIPSGADNIIFFRVAPERTITEGTTDWPGDDHWAKTGDIKIEGNLYTVVGWHTVSSAWSTVTEL